MVDRGLWATSLPDCSFRGAPFHFSEDAGDGGRRAMVHKFPGAETWLVEDLGKIEATFSIDGYVTSMAAAAALFSAATTRGPGLLVTPLSGAVMAVCQRINRAHRADELGRIAVRLELVAAPDGVGLVTLHVPTVLANLCAAAFASLRSTLFAALDLDPLVPMIEDFATTAVLDMIDRSTTVFDTVPLPARLRSETGEAIDQARRAAADPRSVRRAFGAVTGVLAAMIDSLDPDQQIAALRTLATPLDDPEEPYARSRRRARAFRRVTYAAVEAAAAAVIMRAEAVADWGSRAEALAAKARIRALFDAVMVRGGEVLAEADYAALKSVRDTAVTYLTDRLTTLKPVLRVLLDDDLPVVTAAYAVYGSLGRVDDLLQRNAIGTPLMMPPLIDILAP